MSSLAPGLTYSQPSFNTYLNPTVFNPSHLHSSVQSPFQRRITTDPNSGLEITDIINHLTTQDSAPSTQSTQSSPSVTQRLRDFFSRSKTSTVDSTVPSSVPHFGYTPEQLNAYLAQTNNPSSPHPPSASPYQHLAYAPSMNPALQPSNPSLPSGPVQPSNTVPSTGSGRSTPVPGSVIPINASKSGSSNGRPRQVTVDIQPSGTMTLHMYAEDMLPGYRYRYTAPDGRKYEASVNVGEHGDPNRATLDMAGTSASSNPALPPASADPTQELFQSIASTVHLTRDGKPLTLHLNTKGAQEYKIALLNQCLKKADEYTKEPTQAILMADTMANHYLAQRIEVGDFTWTHNTASGPSVGRSDTAMTELSTMMSEHKSANHTEQTDETREDFGTWLSTGFGKTPIEFQTEKPELFKRVSDLYAAMKTGIRGDTAEPTDPGPRKTLNRHAALAAESYIAWKSVVHPHGTEYSDYESTVKTAKEAFTASVTPRGLFPWLFGSRA